MHHAAAIDHPVLHRTSTSPQADKGNGDRSEPIHDPQVGCVDPLGRRALAVRHGSAGSPAHVRKIANIRRQLGRLPTIPPELARLTGPARAIIDKMTGSDATQNAERFRLGRILVKGHDAVQEGHYLVWCRSIGLQPRTAQNYTLLWRKFGTRYEAFCALKTTTIYRLAKSSEEIVQAALEAAKGGALTAAAASSLLAKRGGSSAGTRIRQQSERAIAILGMLDVGVRAELLGLLPRIDLAEVRRHFTSEGHAHP